MKTHEPSSNHEAPDSFTNLLQETIASGPLPPADPTLREALLKRLNQPAVEPVLSAAAASRRRTFFQRVTIAVVSTAAVGLIALIAQWRTAQEAPRKIAAAFSSLSAVQPKVANSPQSTRAEPFGNQAGGVGVSPDSDLANAEEMSAQEFLKGRLEGNPTQDYRSTVWPRTKDRYGDSSGKGAQHPFGTVTGSTATPSPQVPQATAPTGGAEPQPEYTTRGPRDYFKTTDQPAGSGEAKPVSGPTYAGQPEGSKNPGSGYAPAIVSDPKPADPASPEFNAPSKGLEAGRTAPQEVALAPVVASTSKVKPSGGPVAGTTAQLPQGLTPQTAERYYYEAAGKEPKQIDELSKLEWEKTRLASQLSVKDATLPKTREVEDEVRTKFNRVVTLTDELNRAKQSGQWQIRMEQEKLAQLNQAIQEVREVERKYHNVAQPGGEQYARIVENQFLSPNSEAHALSTFAIDVDTASYANVRRFLNNGQLPPPDAVRLEELVNYFKYKYPQPKGDDPFSVNLEMADCPWHPGHKLLRVGLQGKEIHRAERPASNIVFLIDTSGSMTDENKLPLLRQAFTMLTSELGENDKVTIVTYAGNAGLKLEPTRGDQKEKIIAAIDSLQSGGSTNGSAGIQLAYEQAAASFIKGGTNKVILATDGDLNVGITDDAALVELITKQKATGVFLTVLGVGTGNLKDAKMERLANNGNGVYAYLDSVREARKVLVEEMSGSLVTIAQDVKIQVEFNPAQIQSYRLLGYENRVMANKDFRNDAKDAGEIGAGHSVTAMYEVVMAGTPEEKSSPAAAAIDKKLRYQRVPAAEKPAKELTAEAQSGELLTVMLRYKKPEAKDTDEAKEIAFPLKEKGGSFNSASADFQFASAVVAFGLSLRNSEFRGGANLSAVTEIATSTIGEDAGGHRAEFLDLVRRAKTLRGE